MRVQFIMLMKGEKEKDGGCVCACVICLPLYLFVAYMKSYAHNKILNQAQDGR